MIPHARRIDGLHEVFFHITILLAFLTALIGGGVGPLMAFFFPAALFGAALFQRSGRAGQVHNWWWNTLILVALMSIIGEYFFSSLADPLRLGVRFVLILTLIKLFSRQGERDEMQVYALSFLTLAAASNFNEDFFFGVLFGLYVLSGTFGLALFHLKNEASRHPQFRLSRKSPFDGLYMITLGTISVVIFLSSLFIFFAFPRVGLGLFVEQSRQSLSVTGFSENISVGGHGSIRDNPSVVMRVEFEGERPGSVSHFKWRTMTFDTYDQGNWARSFLNTETQAGYRRSSQWDLDFLYTPWMIRELRGEPRYRMQVYLEPMGTNLLPVLWPTQNLRLGHEDVSHLFSGPGSTNLTYDAYGDLRHTMRNELGLTYRLEVGPEPAPSELRRRQGRQLSEEVRGAFLQLPEDLDPRVENLARELTAEHTSNYEKAEAIGAYFIRNFEYTLDLPQIPPGVDPVVHFLFDAQEGHCEYFASAAVLLLRTQGVPTRMVNGFLGGTWNEVGNYLTVRQGDAHAWVEIYVPEVGWVPFEATPPIESTFLERAGITRLLSDTTDALRQAWMKWIIEYDLQSQVAMLRQIGETLSPRAGGQESSSAQQEAEDDDGEPLITLRHLIFFGGWLLLLFFALLRGHRQKGSIEGRFLFALALLATIGALWVGWFQGSTLFWRSSGGLSVLLFGMAPLLFARRLEIDNTQEVTRILQSLENRASRLGIPAPGDQGPETFLKSLLEHLPSGHQHELHQFKKLYLEVRFGGRRADRDTLQALRQLGRQISRKLTAPDE